MSYYTTSYYLIDKAGMPWPLLKGKVCKLYRKTKTHRDYIHIYNWDDPDPYIYGGDGEFHPLDWPGWKFRKLTKKQALAELI